SPTPASVGNVVTELFTRVGHLLYRSAHAVLPTPELFLNEKHTLGESFTFWEQAAPPNARQVANTALPLGVDDDFLDPVDAFRFLLDAAQSRPPQNCFPWVLRGRSHGDLHGRNVLVGRVDDAVHWPALYDYEAMANDNLIGWDFVKLETELKVRAFHHAFPTGNLLDFALAIKQF